MENGIKCNTGFTNDQTNQTCFFDKITDFEAKKFGIDIVSRLQ